MLINVEKLCLIKIMNYIKLSEKLIESEHPLYTYLSALEYLSFLPHSLWIFFFILK